MRRLRAAAARPDSPVPSRRSVAGSGTDVAWAPVIPAVNCAERPDCTNTSATVKVNEPLVVPLLNVKVCDGEVK